MTENYRSLSAPVFNIQTYSIHDGPGIRVTVFLKGCPLRCLWCANPESNLAKPQLMTYSAKCTGCGACLTICPKGAISTDFDRDHKYVAVTDRTLCIDCGACTAVCPNAAREMVGKMMTVDEVLEKVMKDKIFMDASGGGITLSGGEMLVYPDFSEALLCRAKELGLHTAVETCSYGPRWKIKQIFKYVDLGLLDIKHMDSAEHSRLTGVANDIILDNIKYIYHVMEKDIAIRVPTVPGYNDSRKNISDTAAFVRDSLGKNVPIHLLPYHRLGESKNESLGNKAEMGIEVPSGEHMQELKALVETFGIQCRIGG